MTRRYIIAKFSEKDTKTYTYHQDVIDGVVLLAAGDTARVHGPKGWKRVHVVAVSTAAPKFQTKPIEPLPAAAQPAPQLPLGDKEPL